MPADISVPPPDVVRRLEDSLGHRFARVELLALALAPADPLPPAAALGRQRLRFLGDAVWNFSIALAAMERWPSASAGQLTRFRAVWSRSSGLAELARRSGIAGLDLDESDRVLGERLEAVFGAIMQDGGLAAIQALAREVLASQSLPPGAGVDAKSALQMLAQARSGRLPAYRLLERRGPPHRPVFRVAVSLPAPEGDVQAEAEGSSRQAAEQAAARRLLDAMSVGHNIS
jgi:ribonuclease-3